MFKSSKKHEDSIKKKEYSYGVFHEGMARAFGNKRECGYVNCDGELVLALTDEEGNIIFVSQNDINWEDTVVERYSYSVRKLRAEYYFGGDDFENGVARITWTVLPDGRYFEDEDGFGGENNNEVNIYCYIDKKGKVIIPFQGMTEEQIEKFREIAEELIR